jgi:hypothetical protein
MNRLLGWLAWWSVLVLGIDSRAAIAAGRVKLEIFTDAKASITSQQLWLRQLSAAGISDVRIRTGQPGDRVGIEVLGSEREPLYVVTGMIGPGDELVVPGRRFRPTEAAQLARWLEELARKGTQTEEPSTAFGLGPRELEKVQKDLAQTIAFSTRGMGRRDAVRRIGQTLAFPLRMTDVALDDDDKVVEDLNGLSCGTGLACLLRPAGLILAPHGAGDRIEYQVRKSQQGIDAWPVGWPPEKPLPTVVPAMYESFNANIDNVPVTKVLEALSQRLKIPYLFDHNALARHGIEPDAKKVNSPQSRVTYHQLLRRVLTQAGLKYEVRVDEAGKPFLWVTTIKPL